MPKGEAIRGLDIWVVLAEVIVASNLEVVIFWVGTFLIICISLRVILVNPCRQHFSLLSEVSLVLVIALVRVVAL